MSKSDLDNLPKLKPSIKKRWLKALRSGAYKQAEGYLHYGDAFCCLGVLCDVVKDDKAVKLDWTPSAYSPAAKLGGETFRPPTQIGKHVTTSTGSWYPLADRNDNGQSFKQIANIIERRM